MWLFILVWIAFCLLQETMPAKNLTLEISLFEIFGSRFGFGDVVDTDTLVKRDMDLVTSLIAYL